MQFGQRHGTERTSGNPTIETLWSLALGLDVASSDLLEDRLSPQSPAATPSRPSRTSAEPDVTLQYPTRSWYIAEVASSEA